MRFLLTGGRDCQTGAAEWEAEKPKRQPACKGNDTLRPNDGVHIAGAVPPR